MLLGNHILLADRKLGSGHGQKICHSGAWAVKGYICQLMVFFGFLCHAGVECSDFSEVSKIGFSLIPTPRMKVTKQWLTCAFHIVGPEKGPFVTLPYTSVRLQIPHCWSLKRPSLELTPIDSVLYYPEEYGGNFRNIGTQPKIPPTDHLPPW